MNILKHNWIIFLIVLLNGISINNTFSQKLKPLAELVKQAKLSKNFYLAKPFSPLNVRGNSSQRKYGSYLKAESVLQVSETAFRRAYYNTNGAMTMNIPFKNSFIELELVEQKTVSEDFQVKSSASDRVLMQETKGKFYRGIVKGDSESVVSLSIFEHEMMGQISSESLGNITIAKAPDSQLTNTYLVYAENDLIIHNDFKCETVDPEPRSQGINLSTRGDERPLLNKKVRIYYECDYDLYLNKGSSVNNVVNYVTGIFNNVATIYMNEGICISISDIFVWTTPSPYSRTSSSLALSAFSSARATNMNADLGQLLTYGGNAKGGLAYVNTLCFNSYRFSYANISDTYAEFPTYSWTVMVMAHELGHNMGSPHTQWCGWPGGPIDNCARPEGTCTTVGPEPINGGTIMSYCMSSPYGVKFSNGFGTLPGDLIRAMVNKSNCLRPMCASPVAPVVSNISMIGAQIEWTPFSDAVGYKIEYKKPLDSLWTSDTTVLSRFFLNNLAVYDSFQVRVSSICEAGFISTSSLIGFKTLNNTNCSLDAPPSVTNITESSSTVNWMPVQGATLYTIDYEIPQEGISEKDYTTNNSKTLTKLIEGKRYSISVSATCTDITGSPTAPVQFSTPLSSNLYNVTLPLEWLSFNVKSVNKPYGANQVALEWATADEKNIQKFTVERSNDGKVFQTIIDDIIPNNTLGKHIYMATDDNPLFGIIYYRIRYMDNVEKTDVSRTQSIIQNRDKTAGKFIFYPNPVPQGIPLSILTDVQSEYTFKVMDTAGRIVYSTKLQGGNIEIKNLSLKAGIYIYEVVSGNQHVNGKIFVTN